MHEHPTRIFAVCLERKEILAYPHDTGVSASGNIYILF